MPYFWFHQFRRPSPEQVLDVLRNGAFPPPPAGDPGRVTRENEAELGIAPARVYAYLGQTVEGFGEYAVGLHEDVMEGRNATISPFDTGGLIRHHVPVNGWPQADRRRFLQHFSWSADELAQRLTEYPTRDAGRINAYLAGERPAVAGPYAAFPGDPGDPTRVAAIWQDSPEMRAWLWEGRVAELQVPGKLFRWSCAPALYEKILEHNEGVTDAAEAAWLEQVMPQYVKGGVASLVRELLEMQRVAA